MRRILITLAALGAVAAPPASATTVRVEDAFEGPPVQPGVVIEDAASETNTLTISYTYKTNGAPFPPPGDGVVTVEDPTAATLEAGEGCQDLGGNRVRCNVDGLVAIRARLGDRADIATVESPDGGTSCDCVSIAGGAGNDTLTSKDGANLDGEAGDDTLTALPSRAESIPGGLGTPNDDGLNGGEGNDVLDAGIGNDSLTGGPGDDVLRGGEGHDTLGGGGFAFPGEPGVPAGSDRLDGGPGNDAMNDFDAEGGEIGADELIGGTGVDSIGSYMRASAVRVDLSRRGGQGEPGENDTLVNVEVIFGGNGDDVLFGDGDDNQLLAGGGANRVHGRGGDDIIIAHSLRKHRLDGGRGNDVIDTQSWTPGTADCGPGRDRVVQPHRGQDSPRQPRGSDPGLRIKASCEALASGAPGGWGIDPVPDDPVSPRGRLTFKRPRGFTYRKRFYIVITSPDRPHRRIARSAVSKRHGITVRLPRRVARRARRHGITLRAEVWDTFFAGPGRRRQIWRLHVPKAS